MFTTLIVLLAATALVSRGTILDRIWVLNPRAYRQLAPLSKAVGIPFPLLTFALGSAAFGWLHQRRRGWRLAVCIIAIQVLGDMVNIFLGRILEGGVGVVIAGALLLYLLRADVKAAFN